MPLFFQYGCFLMVSLIIGALTYGIYMTIYALQGNNCDLKNATDSDYCGDAWKTRPSIGNTNYEEIYVPEKLLTSLFFVLLLITRILAFRHARKKEKLIDMDYASPGDFTMKITGLPRNISEQEVINIFSNYRGGYKLAQIEKINFAYKIGDYVKYTREKNLKEKKIIVEQAKPSPDYNKINKWVHARNMAEQNLLVVKNKFRMNPGQMFTGICFLTFKTQKDCEMILDHWEISSFGKVSLKYLKCLKKCYKGEAEKIWGKVVIVDEPPEPKDILWENLGTKRKEIILSRILTAFLSFVILGVSFGAILGLKLIKITYLKDRKDTGGFVSTLLNLGITISISVINALLGYAIRSLSLAEKYQTVTAYNLSVARKIATVNFYFKSKINF